MASGYFFLKQRITGVVSTISPIEEKRTMRNLSVVISSIGLDGSPDFLLNILKFKK